MQETDLVDKMAAGYSTQAKTANQFWLVLIITTITVLISQPDKETGKVPLPFEWGDKIDPYPYYTVTTVLLSVLLIAYTSAMVHTIRTRRLAQKFIDKLSSKRFSNGIFVQDYFDSIISPTYNRVAPISQILLGKNQFRHDGPQPIWRRRLCILFYVFLKLLTFVLLYFIPVFAVVFSYNSRNRSPVVGFATPDWVLKTAMGVAALCITILLCADVKYTLRVVRNLFKKQKPIEDISDNLKSSALKTLPPIKKKVINTGLFNITISFGRD